MSEVDETANLTDRIGLEAPEEQSDAEQSEVSADPDEDEEESGDDSEDTDA